ncbi:cytochrome P450 [Delphinella strobiligena]|nr:cytochrome P450 [Delphinella strobiligena]
MCTLILSFDRLSGITITAALTIAFILAAATQWYETYYELVPNGGGMFTKRIKMHDQYGPIVRINPSEVHIDDPEYFETIYTPSQQYDKLVSLENRFNIPMATFSTANAESHKIRRNALAPFFATNKIRAHNPFMQNLVDKISHRLTTEYACKSKVLILNDVFGCLSGDVITNLAFARSYHLIESEEWESPFTTAVNNLVHTTHWTTHFEWILPIMNVILDKIVGTLVPMFQPIIQFRQEMEKQIREILCGQNVDMQEASYKTLFGQILESKVPEHETTEPRLQNEAVSVIGAGFETTRSALTVSSYRIIANPAVYKRLREELHSAIPDPENIPAWGQLSQLPFLSACIEEGLRLGYGLVQRSPRVSRHSTFQYGEYTLGPGTGVSSDAYHLHHHEDIYSDSYTFKPERWLGDPHAPITLASLFCRFDFQLFETGQEAIAFHHDMMTPQPMYESKGVRVIVN